MPVFETSFEVNATLQEVADFHQASISNAFASLTPPGCKVVFHKESSSVSQPMQNGAILEFTLYLGMIYPVRWKAVHEDVSINGFTDRQIEGPMQSWVHRHSFASKNSSGVADKLWDKKAALLPNNDGDTTVITERIVYVYGDLFTCRGFLNRLLFNPLALHVLFFWRAFATRRKIGRG